MNNERVTPKNAAKELQMDVITLRELMKREKLPIGYETEIPCERFDIWEDGEVYCVGLVFSIEDLK